MILVRSRSATAPTRLWAAMLSTAVAAVYAVIAFFPPAGFESPPAPTMVLASLVYLAGAVVILRAGPRVLLTGAALNAGVIVLFTLSALRGTATLDALSVGGKGIQFALSLVLIGLASVARPHENPAQEGGVSG